MDKVKTQDELLERVKAERISGKKIGFTNGCFDIIHAGHVKYLEAAKKECDILIVGVNSDESVKRLKGEARPVNDSGDRTAVLAALESVDFVVIFEEDTPENIIKIISPGMIFKGGDWDESSIVGADHVKANGGKVKVVSYVAGYSTTELIEKIKGNAKEK
ncbi:MAG: D-glycero-beta-D-manno-heptose 1-phosphate adenylyltransferase [Candidatus Omnitrophica bacterium]|nr:D-glycero-beta-D-manno-heptose 1-phosphate adenylyltransferase [Candidatus Omnitrophota bacterium]